MLKNKLFLPLFFLILLGVVSLVTGVTLGVENNLVVVPQRHIRPEKFKTEVSSKVINVSTQSANIRIEEQVLGSKALLNKILTTEKGNDLLVLINKKIRLPSNYAPPDLVSLVGSVAATAGSSLRSEAAIALIDLVNAAKAEGKNLSVVSAYRSYSQQVSVFNGWVASAGLKSAENFSARPGHSQHQLGTAVDLGVEGKASFYEAFGTTAEGVWLASNAYKYGYVLSYPKGKEALTGYSYEPWHYRYIGRENAQKMIGSGLILEEFLQRFGTW
jgi:D-alanyl-D-alanine carboxypeptidase